MRALLSIVALALFGCTSPAELRALDPVESARFQANYRELADCVADDLTGHHKLNVRPRLSSQVVTMTYLARNDPSQAIWELMIRGIDDDQATAELRSTTSLGGRPTAPPEVWAAVERCGTADVLMEAVRQSEPLEVAEFAREYREMTDCVADRLAYVQAKVTRASGPGGSLMLGTITPTVDAATPIGAWELTIRHIGDGRSLAELRSDRSATGIPYGDDAWNAVVSCAGA